MAGDFQADIDAVSSIDIVPAILNVVCRVTGMGFAAVARVTAERWVCLAVSDEIGFGLKPGGELDIETTICQEVRQGRQTIAIDHIDEDDIYCRHRAPTEYGFQSYISVPIFLRDRSFYGTLCAIDPKPAKVKNPGIIGMFELFARMLAIHLEADERATESDRQLASTKAALTDSNAASVLREKFITGLGRDLRQADERLVESNRQLASAEAALMDSNAASVLREQFIAVLGHDLRNPLASIAAGTHFLQKAPLDKPLRDIVLLMQKSIARMTALVDNLLDFARGRLGGGITLTRSREPLEPPLRQVIGEIESIHPERTIDTQINLTKPVYADPGRICQLFSNLLSNAIMHGAVDKPVRVHIGTDDMFMLEVSNAGKPIPEAAMEHLFKPFVRGDVRPSQQGLGLGLYIASEIAHAHGGTIDVSSDAKRTKFTFRMPLDAPR